MGDPSYCLSPLSSPRSATRTLWATAALDVMLQWQLAVFGTSDGFTFRTNETRQDHSEVYTFRRRKMLHICVSFDEVWTGGLAGGDSGILGPTH